MEVQPTVSIVMATYNRSNIIGYTIRSVLWQSYTDWELLIIGDACTDDTADVVASFGDPRISFINLPENHGQQTGPNNEGLRRARGRYIAMLNHDDLWLRDHLATCVARLQSGDADLVNTIGYAPQPDGSVIYYGGSIDGAYNTSMVVPASLWVFTRELAERLGPWKYTWESHCLPAQEWIWRAARKGARIVPVPKLTVLQIHSALRRGSYAERQHAEHDHYFPLAQEPDRLFAAAFPAAALENARRYNDMRVLPALRHLAKSVFHTVIRLLGGSPQAVGNAIRFRRKGAVLHTYHKNRGLGPVKRRQHE